MIKVKNSFNCSKRERNENSAQSKRHLYKNQENVYRKCRQQYTKTDGQNPDYILINILRKNIKE